MSFSKVWELVLDREAMRATQRPGFRATLVLCVTRVECTAGKHMTYPIKGYFSKVK